MNQRSWSFFACLTLGANIVLAVLIGRELWLREKSNTGRPVAKSMIPGLRDKPITLPPRARPVVAAPTTNWPPFRWASVQSANYTNYTANLRNIGCPEETVEAIIEGATWLELARFIHGYATEKHPLLWEILTGSTNSQGQLELAYKPLEAAAERCDELMRALFRKPVESQEIRRNNEVQRQQSELKSGPDGFLPNAKLALLAELQLSLQERNKGIKTNVPPERRSAALTASMDEYSSAVTNMMSATEIEEWRLRTYFQLQERGRSLREVGFVATNSSDFASLVANRTNQNAFVQALGPERAAKWSSLQGTDAGTVEMFLGITRKFGLNGDIAIDAAKAHSAYRNQDAEIDKDPKLFPRERRVLKDLLEQQRVDKLRSLLGSDAWETYRFHHEY